MHVLESEQSRSQRSFGEHVRLRYKKENMQESVPKLER
jgi:hypothetical protein